MKLKKPIPKAKPSAPFKIPTEYLPLEKRTVKDGQDGTKERLRRDMIKAKRQLKPTRADSVDDDTVI